MNELQIFNNPEFGEMRALEIDGEPWFVAADVCRALDIANTTDSLTRLDEDEKSRLNLGLPGGGTNCVNKPGLYTLVLGSRKPEAKAFKRWLTHEVIPAIRKHGAYVPPQAQVPATLDAAALQAFTSAMDALTGMVQVIAQRLDAMEQAPKSLPPLPALADADNPFADCPVSVKPPNNKVRRKWMSAASDKLNALADKCGLPSSSVLHRLYQEMEEERGVILSEVRLRALEEHQLTDCSILLAIFYDAPLRKWFEKRVDQYLTPETPIW